MKILTQETTKNSKPITVVINSNLDEYNKLLADAQNKITELKQIVKNINEFQLEISAK